MRGMRWLQKKTNSVRWWLVNGLYYRLFILNGITPVSTHSRPKAAGGCQSKSIPSVSVSTHSRPKAAGKTAEYLQIIRDVSTHSRPKAAGLSDFLIRQFTHGFNSQPPEGGWVQLDGYM